MSNQVEHLVYPELNTKSPFSQMKAGHIGIRTSHYEAFIQWYVEILGFRVVKEWMSGEMKLAYIAFPGNDSFMIEVLGNAEELPSFEDLRLGYNHICFNVDNIQTTIAELEKLGITIVRHFPIAAIGKEVAFIADPWGNKIEFSADM
ncbi:VOC family protein [Rhizosphaericola mali]|uniref:VOC family protein n=1 Tax=Rhizosphaericola mali TaxID=2545455 RepID=A0A5P2G2L9_9BACT|nr:VOC family protein [Rhizosphaericola mali]QES88349.1 VOC family protein [Rhizosphaericola mali]